MAEEASGIDERCGVCLEAPMNASSLDGCGHQFCAACIEAWAQQETRCPLCRSRFHTLTTNGSTIAVEQKNQVYEWDGAAFQDEEETLDDLVCSVCLSGEREGELLLCERFELCAGAAHASCLGLPGVPDEEWSCVRCTDAVARRERRASARASALSSPAALGRRGEADDGPRRQWVARQRHLAEQATSGRLRTVHAIRQNWEALRTGLLTFSAVGGARGGDATPRAEPARPSDASTLAWNALDAWRAEQAREARPSGSGRAAATERQRQRPAPPPAAPGRRQRSPAASAAPPAAPDGYLAHLASMRGLTSRPRPSRPARPSAPPPAVPTDAPRRAIRIPAKRPHAGL